VIPATTRKPRFQRQPAANPPGFRITDRDDEIILIVARHRIARSTHIVPLIQSLRPGASEQQLLRRLQSLYHTRYLSRPQAQLEERRPGVQPPRHVGPI
jgi:hypothetical protein